MYIRRLGQELSISKSSSGILTGVLPWGLERQIKVVRSAVPEFSQ